MTYASALALTLVIEVPIVVAVRRRLLGSARSAPSVALWALLANLISHPIGIGVVWPLTDGSTAALVAVELGVVAMEAAVFSRSLSTDWWPSLVTSGVVNATSVAIGSVLVT